MRLVWLAVDASHAHRSPALPLIHAACDGVNGVSWQEVQALSQADPGALAAAVDALEPDVVAATLYLFNRRTVLETLSRVKVLRPGCTVVVGGPECLGDNVRLLTDCPYVDIAVRGEGEAALPPILEGLRCGRLLDGVPGVCRRDGSGAPLDDGSSAVYADWPRAGGAWRSPFFRGDGPFACIETSRGCTGTCTYCTSAGQPLRCRPLEAVRNDLEELRRRGFRQVRLLDRTFNVPAERAARLLELFLGRFAGMQFHLEIDPARLDSELRGLLAGAPRGSLRVEAGVQTLAPNALAAVRRPADPERALEGVRFLVGCTGVTTHVDLLAGLPEQTLADVEQDTAAMLAAGPAEIQLETVKVLPGTPLRHEAARLGLRHALEPPYEVLRTPSMGTAALRLCMDWSRVLDSFYNVAALQPAVREALRLPGRLDAFAESCREAGLLTATGGFERRFRHAMAVLGARDEAVADKLRHGWLMAGLNPADPLAGAERATRVPADAEWLHGLQDAAAAPTARLWRRRSNTAEWYYVVDRARGSTIPAACARLAR